MTGALAFAADRAAVAAARSTIDATATGWTMLAFGGLDASGNTVSTTARYNYVTKAWTAVSPAGSPPSPRSLAGAAYLPNCPSNLTNSGCFVVTGGVSPTGVLLGDTSVLYTNGLPQPAQPQGMYWTAPANAALDGPTPRHSAAVAVGIDGQTMYVFGGDTSTGVSNDLFALAPVGFPSPLPPPYSAEMLNLALRRPATASSTDIIIGGNWTSAVDGNTAGIVNEAPSIDQAADPAYNLCASTSTQPKDATPWIRIDLGATKTFDAIQFFGRTDCATYNDGNIYGSVECATRNNDFQIAYGNDGSRYDATGNMVPTVAGYACTEGLDQADPSSGEAFVNCPRASGRYVWLYLPGTVANPRLLTVCELQVLVKQPWAWRQLSGSLTNVAEYKYASQTSNYFPNNGAQSAGSDANLAVDGLTSNDWFSGTCSHTDASQAQSQFVVDLGETHEVSYVVLFPVVLDEATLTSADLHVGWTVTVGYSPINPALNTLCSTPASVAPAPGESSVTISCQSTGRYLLIQKRNGVNGATSGVIALCEAQVFGTQIAHAPAARAGAAATTFRGQLVIFGGYDESGYHLNDVNFFDLLSNKWRPAMPMIGTPPAVRAYTSLSPESPLFTIPLPGSGTMFGQPSSRLVLFGGASDSGVLDDIWELQFPACPPLITAGMNTATTYSASTVWWPVCQTGFVAANGVNPLICGPDGKWIGSNPPCISGPPAAPTNVQIRAAAPIAPGVAAMNVTWNVAAGVDYYTVSSDPVGTFYTGFDAGTTSLAPGVWKDPLNAATYDFVEGWMQQSVGPGGYCLGTVNNCPVVVYPFTTALPSGMTIDTYLTNVVFETHVHLDEASAYPWYEMGIGLYSASKTVGGVTGALEFIATVYSAHQQGVPITAGCAYEPHSANWQNDQNCVYSPATPIGSSVDYYLKIENSANTGYQWEAFFRWSPLREWVTFGRRFTAAKAIGGTLNAADLRVALWTMQELNFFSPQLGFARVMGDFDYLSIHLADCSLAGTEMRVLPNARQPITLTGLTPNSNTSYQAMVSACSYSAGCSTPTVNAPIAGSPGLFLPDVPPSLNAWREVAGGKPTLSTTVWQAHASALAVDGDLTQDVASCAVMSGIIPDNAGFPQWAVDLGFTTCVASQACVPAAVLRILMRPRTQSSLRAATRDGYILPLRRCFPHAATSST